MNYRAHAVLFKWEVSWGGQLFQVSYWGMLCIYCSQCGLGALISLGATHAIHTITHDWEKVPKTGAAKVWFCVASRFCTHLFRYRLGVGKRHRKATLRMFCGCTQRWSWYGSMEAIQMPSQQQSIQIFILMWAQTTLMKL